MSSEDPRMHFGLGDATRVRALRVRFPTAATTGANVDADQIITIGRRSE